MSTEMLEVSLWRIRMVLRLEREAWSMVKRPRKPTNQHTPPCPPPPRFASVSRVLLENLFGRRGIIDTFQSGDRTNGISRVKI